MGALFDYLKPKAKPDGEAELKMLQQRARSYSPEDNAKAKAAGFRNADEMHVYMKQRMNKTGGTVSRNPLRKLLSGTDLMAWHPATTIGMAGDALQSANER